MAFQRFTLFVEQNAPTLRLKCTVTVDEDPSIHVIEHVGWILTFSCPSNGLAGTRPSSLLILIVG